MKQKALAMVLTDKVKSNNFVVVDKIEQKEFKTKLIDKMLVKFEKEIAKLKLEEGTKTPRTDIVTQFMEAVFQKPEMIQFPK